MSDTTNSIIDSDAYWNGEGGEIWVRNMDRSEAAFVSMTAALMARAAPSKGEHVLDVGCGGGVTSKVLAERVAPGGEVLAVDISAPILNVARQRHGRIPNLHFLRADAGTADLGEGRFDLIFSRFGVMFFADPVAAFTHLRRALRPTGRMVFMCWRAMKQNAWIAGAIAAAVGVLGEEHRPTPPADPHAPGPFALADADYTGDILRRAGFGNVAFAPLDDCMQLGELEMAVSYLKNLGPISQAMMPKVSVDQAQAVDEAIRGALRRHLSNGEVKAPSATWIVTATA